jgi:hypothetical protein
MAECKHSRYPTNHLAAIKCVQLMARPLDNEDEDEDDLKSVEVFVQAVVAYILHLLSVDLH